MEENKELPINFQEEPKTEVVPNKDTLVEQVFEQAVVHTVQNDQELKDKVLSTAKVYTETKMQTLTENVDTEHKEAVFNNRKDACECYGFVEKTTPVWATKFMSAGYNILLAIWLVIGSFTFMPVVFMARKMNVLFKHIWLSAIVAGLIYLFITVGVPFITAHFVK